MDKKPTLLQRAIGRLANTNRGNLERSHYNQTFRDILHGFCCLYGLTLIASFFFKSWPMVAWATGIFALIYVAYRVMKYPRLRG